MDELVGTIRALAESGGSRAERAQDIVAAIRSSRDYRWVGLYDVDEAEIAVLAWDGEGVPAYPRFPRDRGLCGAAVGTGETVNVGDVAADPRYLTTFAGTHSEIIVPVRGSSAEVSGLIDVESERLNAFSAADRRLLEECALAIGALWD